MFHDVPTIVAMYADDVLGYGREQLPDPLPEAYWAAFRNIEADPRHRLVVAQRQGEVVATLLASFLPGHALVGVEGAQIEAVRVRSSHRGQGHGQALLRWAIDQAHAHGCGLVQLTTNAARSDVRGFYEALGFVPAHIGMKLSLPQP